MRFSGWGLVLWSAMACAAADEPVLPATDVLHREVADAHERAYAQTLQRFDQALAAQPSAALAVQRCDFIDDYVDEDYGGLARASDDLEACNAQLTAEYPDAPETRVWLVTSAWGEEAIEKGEEALSQSEGWPDALRRELLSHLSRIHSSSKNAARAGELAIQAVALGDSERVGAAVAHLIDGGDEAEAARLLRESALPEYEWQLQARMAQANRLQDTAVALAELQRYDEAGLSADAAHAARAWLRAGDPGRAAQVLGEAPGEAADLLRYEIALARGDHAAAAGLLDFTDAEHFPRQLARFGTIAVQAPARLLTPMMMAGVVLLGFLVLAMALLPLALLVPVHHRGLARRVAGRPATPVFDGIGLRHAWAGVAIFLSLQFVMPVFLAPQALEAFMEQGSGAGIFDALLAASLATSVLAYAMLRRIGWRALWGDAAVWKGAGWVVPVWLAVLAVGVAIGVLAGEPDEGSQKMVRELIEGGATAHGSVLVFLFIAVLTPLTEEWVFRGLLLGGLSRHLSFGWANFWQAAVFALIHGDPVRFPYFLALGLACGLLVRRKRSLALAVALHAVNNAVAWWAMT